MILFSRCLVSTRLLAPSAQCLSVGQTSERLAVLIERLLTLSRRGRRKVTNLARRIKRLFHAPFETLGNALGSAYSAASELAVELFGLAEATTTPSLPNRQRQKALTVFFS